ncbi:MULTISPECIES: hemolysin family protein [unclassified Corynebacterium]|uniref:hemolysin family protein n=1 Tax=unclassified Corynebacterium TaxID=2624378 RepID=UPI0029C9CE46|nr:MULTISPECIES: hemolysin family protein [unclassified Corynebacterium]WPF65545.1 hemolysin family protein [Corynebacterium sp. 22KM0430]WPF68040.1 hemolysin family protein [Corynebacterium sp. 21KM1197]
MTPLFLACATLVSLIFAGLLGTVESAVSSISRARVEQLVQEERPGARRLLAVLERRADHINLLVLLHTLLDAAAAVFAASLAFSLIDSQAWAFAAAIGGVTLVSFVVVGVFSRTAGRQNPYSISLRAAVLLGAVGTVLGPVTRLLIAMGNALAPGRGFRDGPYATEVELREMVDMAQEHGVVEVEERRMIQNIFDLASTTARQVMVPRPEMIWIEGTKTAGQATTLCVRSGHSRIPVVGENIDDIVGVVYLKDLVARTYHMSDGGRSVKVADVMRDAVFIPDSKPLDATLHDMQRDHNHLAMLVDEYGGIAGMISMEDVLEEIVGEITDEYDGTEEVPIEKIGPRTFRVVARVSLDDLEEEVHEQLGEKLDFDEETRDQVDTIAGLVAYGMGRVPLPGSTVEVSGLRLRTEGGHDRRGRVRVRHVVVEVPDPEAEASPDTGGEVGTEGGHTAR